MVRFLDWLLNISRHKIVFVFSFFGVTGSTRIRQPKISRHYFFSFSFLYIYYTTRRIVVKSDEKKKASLVWFLEWQSKYFSSLFFSFCFLFLAWPGLVRWRQLKISRHFFVFFFFLQLLYYAQDSCKKWLEKIDRLSLFGYKRAENFSSLFCFCFCFFSFWAWPSQLGQDSRIFLVTVLFFFFFLFSLFTILRAG